MVVLEEVHEAHGATFGQRGGRRVVEHYGRPSRVHAAVRKVVGVLERAVGVVELSGADRVDFLDNAVSTPVPTTEGEGQYALLLDPQGRIRTDMYVLDAGERLLVLTPPGEAAPLAEDWAGKTFLQDVAVTDRTDEFAVFGVYGPKATEKLASVTSVATPETPLSFVRGSMGDSGVTVLRDDGLVGEEGYLVVATAEAAADVWDSLENRGLNAAPFGAATWRSLTLEAGTPLFETELEGAIPNELGLRNALDFEKGCFVGQEVVSRIHNRGQPGRRLVGLRPGSLPDRGAAVVAEGATVGEVTRAATSPVLEAPVALALVEAEAATGGGPLSVRLEGSAVPADLASLPFVTGSVTSARLPTYE